MDRKKVRKGPESEEGRDEAAEERKERQKGENGEKRTVGEGTLYRRGGDHRKAIVTEKRERSPYKGE